MKKQLEKYTLSIVTASCIIFISLLVLLQLELIGSFIVNNIEVVIYTSFTVSLLLFMILEFILIREKKYGALKQKIISLIAIMVILSIVFLLLLRLDLVGVGGMGAGFALVFVYGLYPFTLLMFIISLIVFLYKRQFKIVKKAIMGFVFWVALLIGYFYLNIIFPR